MASRQGSTASHLTPRAISGTFTACNVAGFSAVAPLASQRRSIGSSLQPLGWLAVGTGTVAGIYGAIGALAGTHIPQLSSDMVGGFPVRLIQSVVVFGVIGSVMIAIGLASACAVRNPLAGLFWRHPRAQVVIAGGLIGAFLVGRPFQLFFKMFQYAASTHDPAFGAAAFVLQVLGNVTLMAGLYLAVTHVAGGRLQRWPDTRPGPAGKVQRCSPDCVRNLPHHILVCARALVLRDRMVARASVELIFSRAGLWELLLYRRGNWVP